MVFQILPKIEMMRKKNRLFGRQFKTVQFFFRIIFFLLQHSAGKGVFYGWFPRGTNGSEITLVTYVFNLCDGPIYTHFMKLFVFRGVVNSGLFRPYPSIIFLFI